MKFQLATKKSHLSLSDFEETKQPIYTPSQEPQEESMNKDHQNPGKAIEEMTMLRQELRKKLSTVEAIYDFCTDNLGYFMPRYDSWRKRSKCVTEEYLWGVITGKYWSIKAEELKFPKKVRKSIPKRELVEILQNILGDKELGFDTDHYPDKNWLKTVIYKLSPDSNIFATSTDTFKMNVPKEYFILKISLKN